MEARCRRFLIYVSPLTIFFILVMILIALVGANISDTIMGSRKLKGRWSDYGCRDCIDIKEQDHIKSVAEADRYLDELDVSILVTYSDPYGAVRIGNAKYRNLSASWVVKTPIDENHDHTKSYRTQEDPSQDDMSFQGGDEDSTDEHQAGGNMPRPRNSSMHPVNLKRKKLRQERRVCRTAELILQDKEIDNQMQVAAIDRAQERDTIVKRIYTIWREEQVNSKSDSTLTLMHNQIIMARAYASIAKAKNDTVLYDSLLEHARESRFAIGEGISDAGLQPSALVRAKEMAHVLCMAKDQLYDCITFGRKLRTMLQSTEVNLNALKKKGAFLTQLAVRTLPRPLHCLPLLLTTHYFQWGYENKTLHCKEKIEDPSLYHYAIISDNILATSVVVNSAVLHAKKPEKHVFHIVTDSLNFAAMKMWFLSNPPASAAIHVENLDDFTWLNSSNCPVLRQLESARLKEYYFNGRQPSSLAEESDNFNYRNPKYLSMLNHLRFYLPQIFPKLDKILFLDDDIVVQKDLAPLWSVNLRGMVNGAVETCKGTLKIFSTYLNFSDPRISKNFDPNACGWAFGMNILDLKEWRKQDITGIYHRWQDMNEYRTLWKLGTLPVGLLAFYNLTYPLDRSWHLLKLGYERDLSEEQIKKAAVIHYNGNYKPWLEFAITKYKSYWSRFVMVDNTYLQLCNIMK
ncbi:unnamed protein product [Ilex paraguariensis]|uniref:Hexosyltransferase n=1 Tax=Ilex paraguariensis TaxID=185542 RepID=A0ABC8S9V0_9AQUA